MHTKPIDLVTPAKLTERSATINRAPVRLPSFEVCLVWATAALWLALAGGSAFVITSALSGTLP